MKQNNIGLNVLNGSDLKDREQEVLNDASGILDFKPNEIISRSAWWGSSEIGAFHASGTFKGKKAILKIQGQKPNVSEIYMIKSFEENNQSKLIRPPRLYGYIEWNEEKRYEALVLEDISGKKIISTPTSKGEVDYFYQIYNDYRKNCLTNPWIEKPTEPFSKKIEENFNKWIEAGYKIYPSHPLRKDTDQKLIKQAVGVLLKEYENIKLEFVHGHFSASDLFQVDDQIVILSNLYWSWRQPYYDAIFGYHWFIYNLNTVPDITPEIIEQQRKLWLDSINNLPEIHTPENQRLLNLALLERAAAGLNLDGLSMDPDKEISKYILEQTREIIKKLISELT